MCRCIYVVNCMLTKFDTAVLRYINDDRYIWSDISRRDLHSVYRYISRYKLTRCQIDLHVVCNLPMDISQRSWKYVHIYQTKLSVRC